MTYSYQIFLATELSAERIRTILHLWQIEAWEGMDAEAFRHRFSQSEFHVLTDAATDIVQCIARVNYDFVLKIGEYQHAFAELVGLVAAGQGRGSGKTLMSKISSNLRERNKQTLGFCTRELRPFYQKCGIAILQDQARYIYEPSDAGWAPTDDDDILVINLSPENVARLRALDERNVAYYTT